MQINSSRFVMSNTNVAKCPQNYLPEYAFIGRSNVGKSSLINSMCGKKNLAKTKIVQMKENAIKEVKNTSIRIAIDSVKKAISTSVDKSKLDILFEKNLKDTKSEFKKINS